MKIKLTAIIETDDGVAFDDLSIESSVGLMGKVVDYNIKYDHVETKEETNNEYWRNQKLMVWVLWRRLKNWLLRFL